LKRVEDEIRPWRLWMPLKRAFFEKLGCMAEDQK